MIKLKYWKRDEKQPKFINFDLKPFSGDGNHKISVHITESWCAQDTGHVMIDFTIQTECGHIEESIYIPKAAFKELIKIQQMGKVTKK